MFVKLFILFAIVPIAELYILIKVAGIIGTFNTILIILITATSGAYLAKSQGLIVLYQIKDAMSEGKIPAKEILHAVLVLLGGFALLTPGFLTDLIGISMLIPYTRHLYIKLITRLIQNKIDTGQWNFRIFS